MGKNPGPKALHVLVTRFMLGQAAYPNLLRARPELFRHFCVPSIAAQQTKRFVWIVYVPDDLDDTSMADIRGLVEGLGRHRHVVPLPTNSSLYTANIVTQLKSLRKHYTPVARAADVYVLTRFDADDALNHKRPCRKSSPRWSPRSRTGGCAGSTPWSGTRHLFFLKFKMYVLPRGFLQHCTHPKSPAREQWDSGKKQEVRPTWLTFLDELRRNYTLPTDVPDLCPVES